VTTSCYDKGANGGTTGATFTLNATAASAQQYEVAIGTLKGIAGLLTPVASGYTTRYNVDYVPSGNNDLSIQYQNFSNGPTTYVYAGTVAHNCNQGSTFLFKLQ
jgi:hypothetical protein